MVDFNLQTRVGERSAGSRQSILEQARLEREGRRETKKRSDSALTIQKVWRGRQERFRHSREVLAGIVSQYAASASDPSAQLLAADVACGIIRPLASALTSARTQAPGSYPAVHVHASLLRTAGSAAALRTAFALIIRSLAHSDARHNVASYLVHALADAPSQAPAHTRSFFRSWLRVCVLCAGLCRHAPTATSDLLASAAARCALLMTDSAHWRCVSAPGRVSVPASGTPATASAAAPAVTPAAAVHAMRECLALLAPQPQFYEALACALQGAPLAYPRSRAQPSLDPAAQASDRLLANLTSTAACLVTRGGDAEHAAGTPPQRPVPAPARSSACTLPETQLWLEVVLQGTAASGLPPAALATLRAQPRAWLAAMLCRLRDSPPPPHLALAALSNLCAVICGPLPAHPDAAGPSTRATDAASAAGAASGAAASPQGAAAGSTGDAPASMPAAGGDLPALPLLRDDAVLGWLYVAASRRVLEQALRASADLKRGLGVAGAQAVRTMAWPVTQRVHLEAMTDLLKASGDEESLFAFYALWVQVDSLLRDVTQARAMSPVISLLAFSTPWMQRMWKQLSLSCHIPLDVPASAQRGLAVPVFSGGAASLTRQQAQLLDLFCTLYSQLLFVLDDTSFYEDGDPFTLANQRAIALSLNSLVLHTHLHPQTPPKRPTNTSAPAPPTHAPGQQVQGAQGAEQGAGTEAPVQLQKSLLQSAQRVVAQLHDHDVRRAFCLQDAWLAPWNDWSADQLGEASLDGNTPASGQGLMKSVLRVLLARGDKEWQDDDTTPLAPHAARVADLLLSLPHCVPYSLRVDLFRALLKLDKRRVRMTREMLVGAERGGRVDVTIRRGHVLEDAFQQVHPLGAKVKSPMTVYFVDAHGLREAGIDHGGLLKELLEQVMLTGFDADYGLMAVTDEGRAFPSPLAKQVDNGLPLLHFLGLIVGKALYEGILLDVPLSPLFVMALQGKQPSLDDVFTLDKDLHRSLLQVKAYAGDAADLGLDFTVEEDVFGRTVTHDLVEGGASIAVTNENKVAYVHTVAAWHLSHKLGSTCEAFAHGMSQVIPVSFLRMFSVTEVNELLGGGGDVSIDTEDMQKHTRYTGGYSGKSSTVRLLWSVLGSLSTEDRRAVLKFVTGTGRAPLGGFKHLEPPLTICKVDCDASVLARIGGSDVDRLPSASTCFNMLKLPNYRRAATLKKKLLFAIHSGAGFDLS